MAWTHNLNPILLNLGPIEIRWYGLMYVLAFIVVYFYVRSAVKNKKINLSLEELDTLLVWLVVTMIIGARLFEVVFYNFSYYLANPIEIIAIWHGGLSFHGGLTAVLITGYIFARKKKITFLKLCDLFVIPLAIAQTFGRIGNFINGELYGTLTSLPWGMKFPTADGIRHPSQLYEAFYNTIIFSFLFLQRNLKRPDGYFISWFLILYSLFRFLTEFVRQPEIMIGPLTLGQCLNIPMFVSGLILLWWIKKK